jgi:hypothetical protein
MPSDRRDVELMSRLLPLSSLLPQHHKNYHKRAKRLRRLRPMKVVPRNIVKRLKLMMPYWRRQLRKEEQYQRLTSETSVRAASDVSYERQKAFIEAQNDRLKEQLITPKAWFPQLPPPGPDAEKKQPLRGRYKKLAKNL